MAASPHVDLVAQINSAVAGLTTGTNLFHGKMRAAGDNIPNEAVFCLLTGGPAPEAYSDGTSIEERHSAFNIRVRSDPGDFSGGQTLARSVYTAVHHAEIAGYIDVRALQSEPLYIGEDSVGHHEWSINVELWHDQ